MPKRRMREQEDANQTIYIDSCFVDAYLWGDRDAKQYANKVFYKFNFSGDLLFPAIQKHLR
jgi:hypothetical protein